MSSLRPSVVSARDLCVRYPARHPEDREYAVNGVSFDIAEGEILAVVGETGSGKSTLAAAVAGGAGIAEWGSPLISGGALTVLGHTVRHLSKRAHDRLTLRVGFLPQDAGAGLASRLTIGENVAEPIFSRDRRFDQTDAGKAVATLIDAVRLPMSIMNRFPHELSRGQRQRVAIAKALILEPVLLVADDPTSGIDVTVRAAILDIIRELQGERSFSALVVTTDLGEVRRITDRVLIMHRGVVVGNGLTDDLLDDPHHPYVVGLARNRARNEAESAYVR
ncbi:MAG: ATP-binding cassette domain-containing protein [Microbacteriaceae bacterium]